MFVELILCVLILIFTWDHLNKKRRNEVLEKSNITGPRALPVVGSILNARGLTLENIFDRFKNLSEMHGKMFRVWILYQLSVNTCDANDIEVLLSSPVHITKNNVYDMLSTWLGDGLLMSTGSKWHIRRKIITPTFHFRILEQFINVFNQQSAILQKQLETYANGATAFDIYPLINLAALDIITETAMGVKINAQLNSNNQYVQNVKIVTNIFSDRLKGPGSRIDWVFRLFYPQKYSIMMENIHASQKYTENIIQTRRERLQQSLNTISKEETKSDGDEQKKRMALLDVLLQANVDGKSLSNEDIREEVETFMFAGHDTTSSAISFTLYLISRYPEVQQQIFDEICSVIGKDPSIPVTYRDLQELKYMECVIKESLRLYPPVPIIGRYFKDDVEINNKIIPGNTHLNMFLFLVLRDPNYFEDPDQFKPERFLPENNNNIYPFSFVPFSAGSRNCIGQKFALLEMKTIISTILRHFELLPLGPEVIRTLSMVMRSKNGIHLGLKPRQC